jgi:hypothetical protein
MAVVARTITGYTRHGLHQAISREGVGVSPYAILEVGRHPRRVVHRAGGITEYIGEMARIRINDADQIVTVIPTSRRGFRRHGEV